MRYSQVVTGRMRKVYRMAAAVVIGAAAGVEGVGRGAVMDTWTDASGDSTWNTTSINWAQGSLPVAFTQGDGVVFNDSSGAGHYGVTLSGSLQPGTVTVTNGLGDYTFSGSGTIGNFGVTPTTLTKLGPGELTIATSAGNGYTGATTVGEGTLWLDFSALASHVNLISSSSPLVLGGGTLTVTGAGSGTTAQTFASTTLNSGASAVVVSDGGGAGTTVTLGLITRNIGSTLDFGLPASPGTVVTGTGNVNGILGGYATVSGGNWAMVTAGTVGALGTYTNDTWAAGNNTDVTVSSAPAAGATTNSLRFNLATGSTVTLSGSNTIQSGGVLITPNASGQTNTITGGSLTSGNGLDLIVNGYAPNGALGLGSTLTNNGSTPIGLTLSGTNGFVVNVTGLNTYTGVTTINDGMVLSANTITGEGSGGGTASSIGQSGNAAGNLVMNWGTLQYVGAGGTTDRLFTLGPGGGTLDASGTGSIFFVNNGAVAFTADAPATLTLTGSNSGGNTLSAKISDPDAAHTYATSVVKNGPGEWILTNANTYTGGTILNGGAFKANNTTGSATGTGPVTVNATSWLGGSGFVGGPVTVNAGGTLSPGDATNFTINNNLTLQSGALASYAFNTPNIVGTGGGNDLTTVSNNLSLNMNLGLTVTPGANFNTGTYTLIHYNTLTDNSGGFNGWSVGLSAVPTNLPSGSYQTMSFQNDGGAHNINLVVSTSAVRPPPLTPGQSVTIVQNANQTLNNSNVNNPVIVIQGGPGGNTGPGGNANTNFFIARGAQPGAKAFSFGWGVALFQLPPGTPYFAPSGVQVGDPAQTGIPISPNAPFRTNAPFNSPLTGPVGAPPFGAIYPAGSIPIAKAPDDWLPAFYLAPFIVFKDPPATPVPTYYGETFSNPQGLQGVYLADHTNGEEMIPTGLDTLPLGVDDAFNYQGSFLSLVQSVLPAVQDLSQLTPSEWMLFDGSFGVDPANSIAWSVNDLPNATYTVVAVGPEPGSLGLLGIGAAALLVRRRRAGGVRD